MVTSCSYDLNKQHKILIIRQIHYEYERVNKCKIGMIYIFKHIKSSKKYLF